MIDSAIGQIATQLNVALRRTFRVGEDLVVVSNLLEQDGTVSPQVANRLAVFLVNIEKESVPMQAGRAGTPGVRLGVRPLAVHLNLLVMFAANFGGTNYPEALKFISATIGFFQSRPVFDHHNTPDLDARIDRLSFEIETLNLSDLSNLWGILSGRYLPSILYRVRLVSIDAQQIEAQVGTIRQPDAGVSA